MPARRPYPTDLSDEEWRILQPLVPEAKPGGRQRAHAERELLNAIFYVLRGGCAWRLLPHDFFLPWQNAYHYFRAWLIDGTWEKIHATLREELRRLTGREKTPSAAIIDSLPGIAGECEGTHQCCGRQTPQPPEAGGGASRL